jgi:hypothetical protein
MTRPLAKGVTLIQEVTTGGAPQIVNVVRVDLATPGVKVRYGQANDTISLAGAAQGREAIHTLAARHGAVAAVNADFFPFTGDPLGIAIRDGELLSEPMEYRVCLGLAPDGVKMGVLVCVGTLTTADNRSMPLHGINRVPQDGEIVVLTPTYTATPRLKKAAFVLTLNQVNLPVRVAQEMQGAIEEIATIAPDQPLPACPKGKALIVAAGSSMELFQQKCPVGEGVTFRFDLAPNLPPQGRGRFPSRAGALRGRKLEPYWADVQQAVGGGPWLVRDGEVYVDGEAEDFAKESFVDRLHPRTAVGVTKEGVLLLVTVDGRQAWSRGASLTELAGIMKRLGAYNAINLDGGGSTSLWALGGVINAPSDGRLRPVANGLLVFGDPLPIREGEAEQIRPAAPSSTRAEGGVVSFVLNAGEPLLFQLTDMQGKPVAGDAPILWGTGDGLGFVSQKGVFTSYRAGAGYVLARRNGRVHSAPVLVLPGAAARISARLAKVPDQPAEYQQLIVTVTDRFGNALAGQKVQVAIQGGQCEAQLTTNAEGMAKADVFWDVEPSRRALTVTTSGGLTATAR